MSHRPPPSKQMKLTAFIKKKNENDTAPKSPTAMTEETRHFKEQWLKRVGWLCYDKNSDSASCRDCFKNGKCCQIRL